MMLTDAQAARLQAGARVLNPPARVVVTGDATVAAVDALSAGARAGVEVVAVRQRALDSVDGPVDVLVIAPSGGYRADVETFQRWPARVIPGGTLFVCGAFASASLTAALLRTVGASRSWRYFGREGTLAEYTRADLTHGERALDAIAQLVQLPSFARSLARRGAAG